MSANEIHPRAEKTGTACGEQMSEGPTFTPLVDIFESKDHILLLMDMPGVGPEGIDIRVIDATLHVKGCASKQAPANFIFSEYTSGDFFRTFALSHLVDASRIEAKMKNGVLRIVLPKAQAAVSKRIEIQTD